MLGVSRSGEKLECPSQTLQGNPQQQCFGSMRLREISSVESFYYETQNETHHWLRI